MQFFKTLFVLTAAVAGHVSAAPGAKSAVANAGEAPSLAARAPAVQTEADQASGDDFDLSNVLNSFTGSSASGNADSKEDGISSLWSGSISDFTQNIIDQINNGSLDFDKMAQEGLGFVNKTIASLDLNSVASNIGRETSKLASRAVDTETLPGGSILSYLGSTASSLLSKIDIDSLVQGSMSATSSVLSYVNFNWIVKTALSLVQGLMG
ncbi:hypothetical protein AK830_g3745 [Neonectria ditissima]|uniref:Uncharacterized protein n=1 Tax=Neonectria ditissima TaxID=78410 RepID=A0A0N8H7V5_9HYPO|nr:hypothetical protein AK830_g3745 [Neonectria ditissima]